MFEQAKSFVELVRKIITLAKPYGLGKLLFVTSLSLAQGVMQVVGVTSIFPFIALAASPDSFRESGVGRYLLSMFPETNNDTLLLVAGIFAIGMLVVSNGINLYSELYRTQYVHRYAYWLRKMLVYEIVSKPYRYFLEVNTGIIVKKIIGDVGLYATNVLLPLLDAFSRLLTVVLLIITLLFINLQIAIGAALLVGGSYGLVFIVLAGLRKRTSDELKIVQGLFNVSLLQLVSGIKPIKVHGAESFFVNRVKRHCKRNSELMPINQILSNVPRYLIEPVVFGGIVALVMVVSSRGANMLELAPTFGVMAMAGYRLLPAAQLLYAQLTAVTTMRYAMEEVYDEFEFINNDNVLEQIEVKSSALQETLAKPLSWSDKIELKDVIFSYRPELEPVLKNVSLSIKHQSSVAIVGATGSGKSTLVDLILGLHAPNEGSLIVDGKPLNAGTLPSWRASVGYVPQDLFLADDTIMRNVAFGVPDSSIDEERVKAVCKTAQISDFIENELDDGYQTMVGERGARLSGGQKQRICLARALYFKPTLLILDEATSALDEDTETALVEALDLLVGKITFIIIAHRLATIRRCEHCYEMKHGVLLKR